MVTYQIFAWKMMDDFLTWGIRWFPKCQVSWGFSSHLWFPSHLWLPQNHIRMGFCHLLVGDLMISEGVFLFWTSSFCLSRNPPTTRIDSFDVFFEVDFIVTKSHPTWRQMQQTTWNSPKLMLKTMMILYDAFRVQLGRQKIMNRIQCMRYSTFRWCLDMCMVN